VFADTSQAQSARDKGFHETGHLSQSSGWSSGSTNGWAESSQSYSSDSRAAVGSRSGAHSGSLATPAPPHNGASYGAPSNGGWSTAPAAPAPAAEPTARDAASGGFAWSQRAERPGSPRRTAAAVLRDRSSSSQVAGAATAGAAVREGAVREGSSPQMSDQAERSVAWRGEVKQAQESSRERQSWEQELHAPKPYKPALIRRGRRRLKRSASRRP
jgi:hypothetical protein